jgi:hypothetical protein
MALTFGAIVQTIGTRTVVAHNTWTNMNRDFQPTETYTKKNNR